MTERMLVLCPSRSRPLELAGFVHSAQHPKADFAVYVAEDDPCLAAYRTLALPNTRIEFGPPLGYCAGLNHLAASNPGYAAYFTGEDDYVCINPNWVELYLAAFRPGIHLVADECEAMHWPHTAAMSAHWVRKVGGTQPAIPGVTHLSAYLWRHLANSTQCGASVAPLCWEHHVPPSGSHWIQSNFGAEFDAVQTHFQTPEYRALVRDFHA